MYQENNDPRFPQDFIIIWYLNYINYSLDPSIMLDFPMLIEHYLQITLCTHARQLKAARMHTHKTARAYAHNSVQPLSNFADQ